MWPVLSGWRPVVELPPARAHSIKGYGKIQAVLGHDPVPIFVVSCDEEEKFFISSMVHSIAEAFNVARRLDHSGQLDDSPQDKEQKAATALFRDKLQEGFCWDWCSSHPLVRSGDVTLRVRNERVELDARMNPILFHIATSVLYCTIYLLLCGDMSRHCNGEAIFFMI